MPDGGSLKMNAKKCYGGVKLSDGSFLTAYCRLLISDSGNGMSSSVKKNLFMPFYSQKSTKKGTGLGMYVVESLINRHGGKIVVKSNRNKGTMFLIYLPLYK
jgi:Signal transduction histidine kinase